MTSGVQRGGLENHTAAVALSAAGGAAMEWGAYSGSAAACFVILPASLFVILDFGPAFLRFVVFSSFLFQTDFT